MRETIRARRANTPLGIGGMRTVNRVGNESQHALNTIGHGARAKDKVRIHSPPFAGGEGRGTRAWCNERLRLDLGEHQTASVGPDCGSADYG